MDNQGLPVAFLDKDFYHNDINKDKKTMTSFANNTSNQLSDTINDHHKSKIHISYRLNFERFFEH